jgi:hypothetical protein
MKRYLFLETENRPGSQGARAIEQLTQGKLLVGDIRERRAQTLLEQLPSREKQQTSYLVTVNRGRVRAVAGGHAAWQLVWLLGPLQGWRVWNLTFGKNGPRGTRGPNRP